MEHIQQYSQASPLANSMPTNPNTRKPLVVGSNPSAATFLFVPKKHAELDSTPST